MPRLRKHHLPHRVTLEHVAGETALGRVYGTPITGVPAHVEDTHKLVRDRRSTSQTYNQEVVSSTLVILLPDQQVPEPGSRVTVWAGTERERMATVITSARNDYPRTPSHIELRLE